MMMIVMMKMRSKVRNLILKRSLFYIKNRLDKPVLSNDEQEKINDDLLYDPDEEEEDEKWMANERLKYIHILSSDFISKF
jgi:hypothetical protein